MKKQTIVIVAHDVGGNGGMESHLEEMVIRLKQDARVIVVASSMNVKDAQGVEFIRIPVIRRPFPLKMIQFALFASIRLLFVKRDILHTTGAIVYNRADFTTVHFCIAGYMKAIGRAESKDNRSFLRRLNTAITMNIALVMEKTIYKPRRTKRVIAVSSRVKEEMLEFFPYRSNQVEVIPNGVNTETFIPYPEARKSELRSSLGLPGQGKYLLFMGGDWQRKGLEYVIDSFNLVAEEFPDLHLLVVGKGDIKRYAGQLKSPVRDRAHFVGQQSNPEQWFGVSDIFLLPTSYETFSLVVHEAAAAGLTILSTKVGGVEDLIEHRVDGMYIERDMRSIERALKEILSKGATAEIGLRARRKVERLTWDHTYRSFSSLYRQH